MTNQLVDNHKFRWCYTTYLFTSDKKDLFLLKETANDVFDDSQAGRNSSINSIVAFIIQEMSEL